MACCMWMECWRWMKDGVLYVDGICRWMVDGVLYVDGMLEMDDGWRVVCG